MVFTLDIETVIRRGVDHENFCEDDLIHHDNYNYFVGVIMDGCSEGTKSHFASSIFGKIIDRCLRFELKDVLDKGELGPKEVAEQIALQTMIKALEIFEKLSLSITEVESTIVLSVYRKSTKQLFCVAFGDGYLQCNQGSFKRVFENVRFLDDETGLGKNRPDYLSYNIKPIVDKFILPNHPNYGTTPIFEIERRNTSAMESFREWFNSQHNSIEFSDVEDFMMGSDGLLSFKNKEGDDVSQEAIDLLYDRSNPIFGSIGNPARLSKKLNVLKKKSVVNHDDVSVIKVLFAEDNL